MWNIAQGIYIHSKAIVAQVLLEAAWARSIHGEKEVKPWPWADTWPVARLSVPRLDQHRIVLAGANGSALAFGPGHLFNSASPGNDGYCLIAGHRDTHFAFLQELAIGDQIHLQNKQRRTDIYEINDIQIINENELPKISNINNKTLILITCYPFNSLIAGGPLRYMVIANAITSTYQI